MRAKRTIELMTDLIAMRNIANHGRGSEMTKALHDTCNEIERLTAELEQTRAELREAQEQIDLHKKLKWKPLDGCPACYGNLQRLESAEAKLREMEKEKNK